jgi:ribulose kinase
MKKLLLLLGLLCASPALAQQTVGPPAIICNQVAPSAALAAGTTQLVVGVANAHINLCGFNFEGLANGTIQLVFGTGSSCTSSTNITEAFTTQVNGNVVDHIPYAFTSSAQGQSLCAVVTGAGSVVIALVYYSIS